MSHKNPISEKNSVEMISSVPSPRPCGQETPPCVAVPRKARPTGKIRQQPVEMPKMADNWNILELRAPADLSFSAAPSNTSTANRLEIGQTRKTSRSLVVSSENSMLPAETTPAAIKASKRSGAPFSPSFVEANKKKKKISPSRQLSDNPKAKSSDAKLPGAVGKPLIAAEPSKKSDFTRKQDKKCAKKSNNPGNQGHAPVSKKQANPEAVVDEVPSSTIMESAARGMLSLSGHDKYYLKQFNEFYENFKSFNTKVRQRFLELDENNIQKHYENESLKSRLKTKMDQVKRLNEKLSEQKQLTKQYEEKYLATLKEHTSAKEDFDSGLHVVKVLLEKKKAELSGCRSEVIELKSELNQMQKANIGMAIDLSQLRKNLRQMEETAATCWHTNNEQAAELEKNKLQMQETFAEGQGLQRKIAEMESALQAMTLERNQLNQSYKEFKDLQLVAAATAEQLKISQSEAIAMRTLLDHKERAQSAMDDRIKNLQAAQISLVEANAEFAKEIDVDRVRFLTELTAKKDEYEETISNLNAVLSQQVEEVEKMSQRHELLEAINLQRITLHEEELKEWNKQHVKLQEVIKDLEQVVEVHAQNLQAEQEKLAKEVEQNRVLTSELEDEKMRHKAGVDALQTVVKKMDTDSSAEQKKMQGLTAELEESKKMNSNLKDEKEQIANQLSANEAKFTEELKFQANSLKNKIFRLQEDLKKKDVKLIGLEHEKNGIIQQLKDKIQSICCTIEQPIVSATLPKSPEAKKSAPKKPLRKSQNVVKPTVTTGGDSDLSGPSKRRKTQPIHVDSDVSDFESDDDSTPLKMLFSKRENLAVVQPRTDDVFDALKKSTNDNK